MTNYYIQLKKTDDVHQYFTWSPEEILAPWSLKLNEEGLHYQRDNLSALEEWRLNYAKIKSVWSISIFVALG